MCSSILFSLVVLTATPEANLPRAVVTDLKASPELAEPARALSEALAVAVADTGLFRVISAQDVQALLGLERQKALLGCSDDATSCMSELANALGADVLVTGSLAKLGDVFQFTIQGLEPGNVRVIGRATRMARDLPSLRATLPFMVAEATGTPAPPEPSRLGPGLLIGVGVAGVITGGVLFLQASLIEQSTNAELALGQEQSQVALKSLDWYRAQAQSVDRLRLIGGISMGIGVALAVTGAILFPRAASSGLSARLVVSPGGFALVGVWP
jgi:hypothetical protein